MKKITKKFRKGQLVVHPQQGIFKLQTVKKREIDDEQKVYWVLAPFFKTRGGLKVFTPEATGEKVGIRAVADKKVILKALRGAAKFLKNNPEKEIEGSEDQLEKWIKEEDFKATIILLGQLYFKLKILKKGKMIERELYKKALVLLTEELAAAKRCSKKYAQKILLEKLRPVLKKRIEEAS